MGSERDMIVDSLVDPYDGSEIDAGRRVSCRTSTTGVTLCKVKDHIKEREKYGVEIFVVISVLLVTILVFSISLEVDMGSGSGISTIEFVQNAMFVIPFITIITGTILGIWFMSRRARYRREL